MAANIFQQSVSRRGLRLRGTAGGIIGILAAFPEIALIALVFDVISH